MILPLVLLAIDLRPAAPAEFRQPQLAAAHGQVALAYAAGSSIWFASSADNGSTFSARVKVADTGALAVGRHRGPRVTILPHSILITAVAGTQVSSSPHAHGLPEKGNLFAWRSVDRGRTWARTSMLTDQASTAEEGLHSIAQDSRGNLFAAWLDHRNPAGTQLWGASSSDEGRTWSKNVLIYASPDGTICQCCDPTVAFDAGGRLMVMWRNVLDGSRDFYLTSSSDGQHFTRPEKLGRGTWKLNACPMDGGGIVFDSGQAVTAWRREDSIFLDRPGSPEVRLGTGKDVAIAESARGPYVIWSSAKGIEASLPGAAAASVIAPSGSFPAAISLPDGGVLAAWEDVGSIRIKRLP